MTKTITTITISKGVHAMYYILGIFRRTALWGTFLVVLASFALASANVLFLLIPFLGAYMFFVLLHLLICKIQKDHRTSGEAYLSALGHDIVAPFSKLGLFFAVLFKKWVINDDSKLHNFIDGLQVVLGGIWALIVWGIAVTFTLMIVL